MSLAAGCSGSAYSHAYGEVCSPYAQGAPPVIDGGIGSGDCITTLSCVCATLPGCVCSSLCQGGDGGGGTCPSGYFCAQARNVNGQSTNSYCLPDAGP